MAVRSTIKNPAVAGSHARTAAARVGPPGNPPLHRRLTHSGKTNLDCIQRDSARRGGPYLAWDDRHRLRQGTGADDLPGDERRIKWIARQQPCEMAQRRERAAQHVCGMATVNKPALAIQI